METLSVSLGQRSYRIVVGSGHLADVGTHIVESCRVSQAAIVSTAPIYQRYGRTVLRSLAAAGLKPTVLTVPDGERAKSLRWASYLYDRLLQARYERGMTLIALGGGVVGDLTGFVASTYLRGVHYVQVPTTLVAQVDASIGGKTAVNHPKGKNLIGTFYQPELVSIDVALLRTLPRRDLIGGLAEVVKYGVIADVALFGYLEQQVKGLLGCQPDVMEHIVLRSVGIKADIVSKDEREAGLRRILNYGHTLGHAIETVTGYRRFHHGEAIAIGMEFSARLAARMGICDQGLVERQSRLLKQCGLPTKLPARLDQRRLWAALALDKKVKGGKLYFVLPERLGSVTVAPVEQAMVQAALRDFSFHS